MLKRGNEGVWRLVQRDMKLAALGSVVALIAAVPVVHAARMSNFEQSSASSAQSSSDDWCREDSRELSRDRERVCEVRTLTLAAPKIVDAEAANGSLSVTGTSRRDVRILAKVVAEARSKSQATSIAADVKITTADGRVRADGPRTSRGEGWSVSYRIETPNKQDVRLGPATAACISPTWPATCARRRRMARCRYR
jgi:hypothetical protein